MSREITVSAGDYRYVVRPIFSLKNEWAVDELYFLGKHLYVKNKTWYFLYVKNKTWYFRSEDKARVFRDKKQKEIRGYDHN